LKYHETELQAEVYEQLGRKAEHTAIDGLGKNHVVAGAEKPEDRVNPGHAG